MKFAQILVIIGIIGIIWFYQSNKTEVGLTAQEIGQKVTQIKVATGEQIKEIIHTVIPSVVGGKSQQSTVADWLQFVWQINSVFYLLLLFGFFSLSIYKNRIASFSIVALCFVWSIIIYHNRSGVTGGGVGGSNNNNVVTEGGLLGTLTNLIVGLTPLFELEVELALFFHTFICFWIHKESSQIGNGFISIEEMNNNGQVSRNKTLEHWDFSIPIGIWLFITSVGLLLGPLNRGLPSLLTGVCFMIGVKSLVGALHNNLEEQYRAAWKSKIQ